VEVFLQFQRDQLAKEVDALSGVTAAHAPFYHVHICVSKIIAQLVTRLLRSTIVKSPILARFTRKH
jgi:predicted DNA-binding protein with PD1-like motif